MASINYKEAIFDNVKEEADAIRKQIEGAKFYGIMVSEYPNQADVELVIAYDLMFIKNLAKRVEMPELSEYIEAGGTIEKRETI